MKREYPDRPIVGVGAVVLYAGKFLSVLRGSPPLQGEWSLPGGVLELGEMLREAVVREVLEETGIVIAPANVIEVFDRLQHDSEGRVQYHYVLVDFLCEYISGEPRAGDDAIGVKWVSLKDLDGMDMPEFTKTVIRKAVKMAEQSTDRAGYLEAVN